MEIRVVSRSERELVLEIYDEDHTLGNLLAKEAIRHPGVEYAAYRVPHPLKNMFEFTIIVKPGYTVESILRDIVNGLKNSLAELRRLVEEKVVE
ncbi:DNA-directed RNA polymerase, subunit L [Desulfurococcus amylolyticus 1221n]|uniref:DNA-directed RNA polymerase subunit Rpo11 n=1 Tax=Desulfurococcus amylolyticus (strain DSM 18924 / JCM 16383 / VKM B-2413 / 1221n) TaxID=490899 RepID=B8D6L1_DESA1|nr:DNA-directed RNA polymerase subunit L [Desulfurococcus amylolyticus]ACL11742.1 DNA-directed RNA polymerase, subunit L [Desulfurococcus amylolyticus 1221n]